MKGPIVANEPNEHPWLAGDLAITASVLSDVDAHAVEEYPNESC